MLICNSFERDNENNHHVKQQVIFILQIKTKNALKNMS